ncbi:MAG TPA: proton-translocating transhydrogenase family protein [Thermoanaerobaculia bacterium]|nr:proton-translocating transhydrogenase family protein [Thermoanaerobaculia bacterium]
MLPTIPIVAARDYHVLAPHSSIIVERRRTWMQLLFLVASSTVPATPQSSSSLLYVLLLGTLVGLGVIGRVSRLLHTPLMSLTNAISAIAVVGAIVVAGVPHSRIINILGAIAVFASMTNIVSGFLITDRMLKMFRQKGPKQ